MSADLAMERIEIGIKYRTHLLTSVWSARERRLVNERYTAQTEDAIAMAIAKMPPAKRTLEIRQFLVFFKPQLTNEQCDFLLRLATSRYPH